jgi:hypothetical protein
LRALRAGEAGSLSTSKVTPENSYQISDNPFALGRMLFSIRGCASAGMKPGANRSSAAAPEIHPLSV